MSGGHRFYNEEEVQAILQRASKSSLSSSVSKEQLIQTAAELGIPAEVVERAERELQEEKEAKLRESQDLALWKTYRTEQMGKFLAKLAGVGGFIVAAIFLFRSGMFWLMFIGFPSFGWGSGLIGRGTRAFAPRENNDHYETWKALRKSGEQPDTPTDTDRLLSDYVQQGGTNKIGAIKMLRESLGLDLSTSKRAVEEFQRRNPGQL